MRSSTRQTKAIAATVMLVGLLGARAASAQTAPPGQAGPAATTSRTIPPHRGGLAMPFLGMHSIRGDEGEQFDAGLRVGLLLGGYAFGRFSFNGEIALDWANPDVPGADITAFMGDLAFSPLYHAPLGPVELIAGPKLGLFYAYSHSDLPILGSSTATSNGWTFGLNMGVMVPLSRAVSGGLLLAYQIRDPRERCGTTNSIETCVDGGDSTGILAVNLALLF